MHRLLLVLASAVLIAAVVLEIGSDDRVVIPVANIALPGTCTFKRVLATECPGCGMTRCFISMAHGDWASAWTFNPAGIALFGFVAVQIPYRLMQLSRLRKGRDELQTHRYSSWILIVFTAGLIAQWLVRVSR